MERFSFFGFFLTVALFLFSCGSGSDSSSTTNPSNEKRYLARNVVFNSDIVRSAYAESDTVDTETQVLAENVIYQNSDGVSEIEAENVEEALTETNADLTLILPGKWNTTNLGQQKSGEVTFNDDGTYEINSGYFEAGGSWDDVTIGTFSIYGNIIAFAYSNLDNSIRPVSRFALIVHKRPNKLTIAVQGHTHGIEVLEKVE
ncbi:MAG: hypothetical protein C4522_13430 [Desulfobacteraceae bacterium]|nr:MAG: hypothetical protein C4522_13430 [Desulfobacteraceae bacterium]